MLSEVSVVIPCYKNDTFLAEALNSVSEQSAKPLEIIVVDDGSPEPLKKPDNWNGPELRWIRTENQGLGAARNVGIVAARGKYVALLDADDKWHPQKLAGQVKLLEAEPEVVACYTWCLDAPGYFPFGPYPDARLGRDALAALLWQGQFFPPSSVMMRTAAARAVNGFREGLKNGEDLDMWFRLLTQGDIFAVPEKLCWYRQHDGQITSDVVRKILGSKESRRQIIEKHSDRLIRGGIDPNGLWDAYRSEILCVYYRRDLIAARVMLWDFWKDHPGDIRVLLYCFASMFPAWLLRALRGKI